MLISTDTCAFLGYSDFSNQEVLKLIKDSGFDAYDFSMDAVNDPRWFVGSDDYLQKAKNLRKYADSIGIVCNQSHAPFPSAREGDNEYNQRIIPLIGRALEVSGVLGAKICIVHPCNTYTVQQNIQLYSRILPYAKKSGVKIGVENMWNWDNNAATACSAACSHHEEFLQTMSLLDGEWFTACVDLGHAAMAGLNTSPYEMITTLKDYVGALHIHTNDGIYDNHTLPFVSGGVDMEKVICALAEINYRGDITLESSYFTKLFPNELYPEAARFMAKVADYIRQKVLAAKQKLHG